MLLQQQPLAERMRPQHLDDYLGQEHLVGKNGVLRKIIESGNPPSILLWGPPGTGKTTLAQMMAHYANANFHTLSAVSAGVKEVREVIKKAAHSDKTILFIDEIHRFNKSQQDALLGAVEKGTITLIGATTENPSFEVVSALLSRCQVYTLKSLEEKHLTTLVDSALTKDTILKTKDIEVKETEALFRFSGGDARKLLNLLELVSTHNNCITNEVVMNVVQSKVALYDKNGEQHYDIVSALIKSIRGSDPNGAVYWLARMIEGGEDVKYIARRLLISASEDIGLANPTALVIANDTFQAVNVIGYPEAEIILSQCAIYLATSPKSNASYMAIKKAKSIVRQTSNLDVPLHLRNAPTKLMKDMDYGKDYQYAHDFPENFVPQEYLPKELEGQQIYTPNNNAREAEMAKRLKRLWGNKYGY